ncbi:hypothetical protein OYT00_06450 [Microbacterium paraoxydans]|uniref:hypothetical protein n=1 Tax=Microbacterium TaxID=33882 RepID=UPI002285B6A4|nr:hypothetical protein [Microbacterium paraoxydans]MCZ0709631.1 hypothetical protein [Microbacterium paraoxydans]
MTDPQLPPPSGAVPPAPPTASVPQDSVSGAIPPPAYASVPPRAPAPYPPTGGYGQPAPPAAPPGAYQVPVGGYAAPSGTYTAPDAAPKPSGFLGLLALGLSILAAVVMPIIGGVSAFEVGRRIPQGISGSSGDLGFLSPARDQVLWTELSFWAGTVFGIAAIVLGIIAIRRKQGRGAGIAALIVAVLGAVIFFVAVFTAFAVGGAAGYATFTT